MDRASRPSPDPAPYRTNGNGDRTVRARMGIAPTLAAPAEARAFIRGAFGDHPKLPDLLLGASELVTNAVRHAGMPPGSEVVVTAIGSARRIRLDVSFPGPAFSAPVGLPSPDIAAGRGLAIIDAIADRWGIVQSEEMVVWFEIDH